MADKENRFTSRPFSLQELIHFQRFEEDKDWESLALLMESRRLDPSFDVRSITVDELNAVIEEMGKAAEVGHVLVNLTATFKTP